MNDQPAARFELSLPAEAEAVGTARLFAVAVARAAGCSEEVAADVRIAISEAVTRAIRLRAAADPVIVGAEIGQGKGNVAFDVGGAGGVIGRPDDTIPDLSLEVIRSLFPVQIDANDPDALLRFSTAGVNAAHDV